MYGAVKHMIEQHEQLSHRRAAASTLEAVLREEHGVELERAAAPLSLYVDLMDNAASLAFGALPERLVILRDDAVVWIGGKGPEDYSVAEMRVALASVLAGSDPSPV